MAATEITKKEAKDAGIRITGFTGYVSQYQLKKICDCYNEIIRLLSECQVEPETEPPPYDLASVKK